MKQQTNFHGTYDIRMETPYLTVGHIMRSEKSLKFMQSLHFDHDLHEDTAGMSSVNEKRKNLKTTYPFHWNSLELQANHRKTCPQFVQ